MYLVWISVTAILIDLAIGQECRDYDNNCRDWIISQRSLCSSANYIIDTCLKSCGRCVSQIDKRYDVRRLPHNLQSIGWLVGIWRSEHGGKAIFPTIPKFTYGEQIEIGLPSDQMTALKALNYSAFAWGINERDELHSEYGYITIQPGTDLVALTTVMNNGFVTVEEGRVESNRIQFRLRDIGRISFSRDLPVHDLIREWTLLDEHTMQARLDMETLTHGMQEHTFIRYTKIYP